MRINEVELPATFKVRCIDASDGLTVGKIYEVYYLLWRGPCAYFGVKDNAGYGVDFSTSRFETVDKAVAPR